MDAHFYVTAILAKACCRLSHKHFLMDTGFNKTTIQNMSRLTREYMENSGIIWWQTPPESPDLNPIEMLLHELKHFLRNVVKAMIKDELLQGIARFWREKLNPAKCLRYIGHIQIVLPIVVEQQGPASGH